jgi:hypothetical protein
MSHTSWRLWPLTPAIPCGGEPSSVACSRSQSQSDYIIGMFASEIFDKDNGCVYR